MNLLPQAYIQRLKAQKQKIGLFLLQIFIILVVVASVLTLEWATRHADARLNQVVGYSFDDGPFLLVQELAKLRYLEEGFAYFIDETSPMSFCPSLVTNIVAAQPYGGSKSQLIFDGAGFLFVGEVRGLDDAKFHRQALVALGIYNVHLGRVHMLNCGRFEYKLGIWPMNIDSYD